MTGWIREIVGIDVLDGNGTEVALQKRQRSMPRHHGDKGTPRAAIRVEPVGPLEKIEQDVLAVIVTVTGRIPDLPGQTSCTAAGCAHCNGECRLVLQWKRCKGKRGAMGNNGELKPPPELFPADLDRGTNTYRDS